MDKEKKIKWSKEVILIQKVTRERERERERESLILLSLLTEKNEEKD